MTANVSSRYPLPPMTYEPRKPVEIKSKAARKIELSELTPSNIGQLRKLNSVLFPVRFGDKWYKDALSEDSKEVCKFGGYFFLLTFEDLKMLYSSLDSSYLTTALFNDIPVGNICCRFEKEGNESVKLYIMTLGCLAPYRRQGIASKVNRAPILLRRPIHQKG